MNTTNVSLAANMTPEQIVRERPHGWNALLLAALIDEGLFTTRSNFNELVYGESLITPRRLGVEESRHFILGHLTHLKTLGAGIMHALEEIDSAAGGEEKLTDVVVLRRGARALTESVQALVSTHRLLLEVRFHPTLKHVHRALRELTEPWLDEFDTLPRRLREFVATGENGPFKINLDLSTSAVERLGNLSVPWAGRISGPLKDVLVLLGLISVAEWFFGEEDD